MYIPPTRRNVAMPIMLGVLGFAILIFFISMISLLKNRAMIQVESIITLTGTGSAAPLNTLTQTSTITPTSRPTWTPPPSPTTTITVTPTPTRTYTQIPSLTPAQPQTRNSRYRLNDWNLVEADRIIALLEARAAREGVPEWYHAAAFSQQEALLRFPDALEATGWRWQIARNLVQAGDPEAISDYIALIQSALDAGQVRSSDLPIWFQFYEKELTLEITSLQAKPGELGRSLIQISGSGSIFLWLLETPNSIQVIPLLDDFEPIHDPQSAWHTQDLTGDGEPELIIYRITSPGETHFPKPWIFDQSQTHPPAWTYRRVCQSSWVWSQSGASN